MRVLLFASAFNSLTQRVFAELRDDGHQVAVELALGEDSFRAGVRRHRPRLVIAPMLKSAVPRDVWSARTCLIVHPGPVGDRGPSSLDHAILDGAPRWGVTVLQAGAVMDAGDVWAWEPCAVPPVGKSDLYRGEIADAALAAVRTAVRRFVSGTYRPAPQDERTARTRARVTQCDRRIDWGADPTETVLRKLRSGDSQPGVRDEFAGGEWFLHGGVREGAPEAVPVGRPGEIVATREGAVCRATVDGAVWVPELRERRRHPYGTPSCKLPATVALAGRLPEVPELRAPAGESADRGTGGGTRSSANARTAQSTWAPVRYHEAGDVGLLRFSYPGGAMSAAQCRRLLRAYRFACTRPTSVLLLGGARDFFSNGIHLGVIEAAPDPAAVSWDTVNAMDDLVEAVLTTTDRLTVAALGGNASAGGAMLALAADEVWCRQGVVLNPHYRLMGLYGSEFWTYSLPRRVGAARAERLLADALPVSAASACRMGLVDRLLAASPEDFESTVWEEAGRLAARSGTGVRIAGKKAALERQQAVAPLAGYRRRELARMRRDFDDPDAPYHTLRAAFVHKERPTRTPEHLTAAAPR
jgi:putative two-component system protein, hydrogenase maturation factor HypX/HoxX